MQEKSSDINENFSVVYYVKFKLAAPKMRPLCQEIESRSHQRQYILCSIKLFVFWSVQPDIFLVILVCSYATLVTDCYSAYFQQRRMLLEGEVYRKLLSISQSGDINHIVCSLCIWSAERGTDVQRRETLQKSVLCRYEWDVRIWLTFVKQNTSCIFFSFQRSPLVYGNHQILYTQYINTHTHRKLTRNSLC